MGIEFQKDPGGDSLERTEIFSPAIPIDIVFKSPVTRLISNFAHTPFTIDGTNVASMEGLLQGLKFPENSTERLQVFRMSEHEAKRTGSTMNPEIRRSIDSSGSFTIVWQNKQMILQSDEYFQFIKRALTEKFKQNEDARKQLLDTVGATLTHTTGLYDNRYSVLPARQFCEFLHQIRLELLQ